ncbi:unnamed protein product, partial [Onchocerca ochengi]|uniref:Carn_acyltransf domain-containing protein n=1 Tax=Onchocerca ochengi TaxID=42157 RepID=A0A182EKD7_ONCOC
MDLVYSPKRKRFTGNNSFAKLFGRNLKTVIKANYMTYSNLPKYPIPLLHNTVTKFMAFARPLQNDVEYSETVEVANKFLQSEKAHELQALLEKRGDEMSNWLTSWWIDETYLSKRNPLPLYSSTALLFPKFDYSNLDGQLEIAAKIIQSSLKYYLKIVKNELPQQKFDNSLLCMNQFRKIFGTTRIPETGKDNILYGCDKKSQPKHIIILRKGHIFRLPVFDGNGKALSIKQLINEMKMHIVPQSEEYNLNPIGVISSDQRDIWADIYAKLKEKNSDEIKIIEDSLFAICLDQKMTKSEYDDTDNQALQCFHGGGCHNNSINRWFDKTIQYIVGTDGHCGMTYDCSPSEVSIAATLMDFICHEIKNNDFDHNDASGTIKPTVPIRFSISETDKDYILQSKRNIDRIASDTDIKIFTFEHFGRDLIQKYNISPNSFIQIGMEIAYYRMYGKEAC